jgi:hypothetical protein
MRFFEFEDDPTDRFVIVIRNLIGRAASQKMPAKMNWQALNQLITKSGAEPVADYETFKAMYDANPALQTLVKNFNADGIELNVPGVADEPTGDGTKGPEDSQAAVDQAAASAAPAQLAQATATPQV